VWWYDAGILASRVLEGAVLQVSTGGNINDAQMQCRQADLCIAYSFNAAINVFILFSAVNGTRPVLGSSNPANDRTPDVAINGAWSSSYRRLYNCRCDKQMPNATAKCAFNNAAPTVTGMAACPDSMFNTDLSKQFIPGLTPIAWAVNLSQCQQACCGAGESCDTFRWLPPSTDCPAEKACSNACTKKGIQTGCETQCKSTYELLCKGGCFIGQYRPPSLEEVYETFNWVSKGRHLDQCNCYTPANSSSTPVPFVDQGVSAIYQ
jgi:hypothetical protein